jgi:hypothetical protein
MKWTGHADKPLPAIIAHKGIKEKLKRELHMSWPKKGYSQDTAIGISPFLSKCFDLFAFLGSGISVAQVGLGS